MNKTLVLSICFAFLTGGICSARAQKNIIKVISPTYRSEIRGKVTVKFLAPGFTSLTAKCWKQDATYGSDKTVALDVPIDANGKGYFVFPADLYPHGPITIRISGKNDTITDVCYLQLFNRGGVSWNEGLPETPPQAAGKILVFADDFTSMPSISRGGIGATYNCFKAGGDEYGDAICVPPSDPYDVYYQTESYLRIRASYQPDIKDPRGWNRKYVTGMLTSERTDGTGIYAKYGYFECRMMAQRATGSWPAFWFITQGARPGANPLGDELDAIEGYGSWTVEDGYMVGKHEWGYGIDNKGAKVTTTGIGGGGGPFDGFHTYGLKVTPTDLYYYYDNVLVWTSPTTEVAKTEPVYFMINNELGGGWPIDLSRYNNAVDLWIDWVRVYQ
jgi:hypothetical protein